MTKAHDHQQVSEFLTAAAEWVCDGYSLDVRYLALNDPNGLVLWDARVGLFPLKSPQDHSLELNAGQLSAGQIQLYPVERSEALRVLLAAADGQVWVRGCRLTLPGGANFSYQSGQQASDRWFVQLELAIHAEAPVRILDTPGIDDSLRGASPPFDGIMDLVGWLGLRPPEPGRLASITCLISPPADIIVSESELSGGSLRLAVHAHHGLDVTGLGLAIRILPGEGLSARRQVADQLKWSVRDDGLQVGIVQIPVPSADSALAILMLGETLIRRHWFSDSTRSSNLRVLAVQQYDGALKMVRDGLFVTQDGRKFEKAVAGLLFLLGLAPMMQLETDAPDLVVTSPRGRILLVECTTRVADLEAKIGKLVDRRGLLRKALQSVSKTSEVLALLVCQQPRDQLLVEPERLRGAAVMLASAEDIRDGLTRVHLPLRPDELIDAALGLMANSGPIQPLAEANAKEDT